MRAHPLYLWNSAPVCSKKPSGRGGARALGKNFRVAEKPKRVFCRGGEKVVERA